MSSDGSKTDVSSAVIGAGTMGHGIALVCALNGYQTYLMDVDETTIRNSLNRIGNSLKNLVSLGIIDAEKADSTLTRIKGTTELAKAVEGADFVIEAVPEKMELKKQVFKELDDLCPERAILASNTSTLRISEIAEATKRPDKVIGTHWMNPPYIFPLVEVIRGDKTSRDTLNVVIAILKKMEKEPVVCKDVPGFIVNRMQHVMLVEALNLLEEGVASIEDIDRVWTRHLGIRYSLMGPIEVLDSFGLDVALDCQSCLYEELKDPKFRPPKILERKVRAGELGLKSGIGFRSYRETSIEDIVRERDERIIYLLRKLKTV